MRHPAASLRVPWLGGALVCALLLGPSPGRAAEARPRASLVVQALDAGAERDAVRLYRLLSEQLRAGSALRLAPPEAVVDLPRPADGPVARAEALLLQGKRAYDTLELEQAAQLLGRAAATLEAAPEALERETYTKILTYLGASRVLLDRPRQGRDAFRRLLLRDPSAELDPVVFPPQLVAVFQAVAGEVRRLKNGALWVEPSPAGAELWVDGVPQGVAPARVVGLVAGTHLVQLRRLGYLPYGAQVKVLAGAETRHQAELEVAPGTGVRLRELVRRLGDQAPETTYPQVVDELLGWFGAERLYFLRVGGGAPDLRVQAFCYDGSSHLRLKAVVEELDGAPAGFAERLGTFFASLIEEPTAVAQGSGEAAHDVPVLPPAAELAAEPLPPGEEPDEDSVWSSWWLWTCIGVVVVGGLAAGLALGLPGESSPTGGEVVFSF